MQSESGRNETRGEIPAPIAPSDITSAINQHAIVSITDARGQILYANEKFIEISGYSHAELIGQNHRIIRSGEHSDDFFENLWQTIRAGKTWQGTLCNRRKSGSRYWVESTIVPVLDETGLPCRYVAIRTDISSIARQQIVLKELQHASSKNTYNEFCQSVTLALSRAFDAAFVFIVEMSSTSPSSERGVHCIQTHASDCDDLSLSVDSASQLVSLGDRYVEGEDLARIAPDWFKETGFNAYIGVSLHDSEGQSSGIVGMIHTRPFPHEGALLLLKTLADRLNAEREREKNAVALVKEKERLRRGQYYANIGTWDWDIVTGSLHWTERIPSLFGYPDGGLETTYENFINAVHPDDRERVQAAVNAAVESDVPYEIEHRVIWLDGTVKWVLERGSVIRDNQGHAIQMLGAVQDINTRKIIEMSLQEREHQLSRAQQLAELGWWNFDSKTGELHCSKEYLKLLGLPPNRPILSYADYLSFIHPDDQKVAEFPLSCQREKTVRQSQYRIRRPDGRERYIREVTEFNATPEGQLVSASGTAKDITQSKMLEVALVKARDDAEKANRAKSDFLSSMSHELRTPMNAILGFAQLMQDDRDLSEDSRENVDEILKAGRHLLTLINEVLDLAKIEAGRLHLSLEPVNVQESIEDCLSLSRLIAEKANVKLEYVRGSSCEVLADRVRLKQVILNLVSNAIKYNRHNGSVAIVVQPCELDSSTIEISVVDTGKGMNQRMLERLFQPFERLGAEETKIEGTGIGLSITRQLVTLMQGTIVARSSPEGGSCFTVRLPCAQHSHAKKPQSAQISPPDDMTPARQTLLYIEDNPVNLKLVGGIIKRIAGLSLITAHTPELGLELTLSHKPDLILCDINLPGMDGYEIVEILKASHETSKIPVIAVTANASPEDIQRGKQAGFDAYLTKPLDITEFSHTVQRFLK